MSEVVATVNVFVLGYFGKYPLELPVLFEAKICGSFDIIIAVKYAM